MFSVILSFILVIIGALNWLTIGFFQFDMVAGIFGTQANIFSRAIYILVGLAGIYLTFAVIKYKAKLEPMANKINHDMDKSMQKLRTSSTAMNTEASKEIFSDNNKKNTNYKTNNNYHDYDNYSDGFDYNNSRENHHIDDDDDDEF